VSFQKIAIPTPWWSLEIPGGRGTRVSKPKYFKEDMNLHWNFWRGGGKCQTKEPSVGGIWILTLSLPKLSVMETLR